MQLPLEEVKIEDLMKTFRIGLMIGLLTLNYVQGHAQNSPGKDASSASPLRLSLRDAVKMALSPQGNYTAQLAGESVHVAESNLRASRSAFLPSADISVTTANQLEDLAGIGLTNVKVPIPNFTFPNSSGSFNSISAQLHVKQVIFDMASIHRKTAATSSVKGAGLQSDAARDQVTMQVAKLYIAAQRAASDVDTEKEVVATSESTLAEVQRSRDDGKALDLDVAKAKSALSTANLHLKMADMERDRTNMDLLLALNRDLDTPLELTDQLDFANEDTPTIANAIELALKSRNDLEAQRRQSDSALENDKSVHSEYLPSVVGFADAGSMGNSLHNSIGTYDVGASLRIPVFDENRNSRRQESKIEVREANLRTAQMTRQVELQVREALEKLDVTRAQVQTAMANVDVAEQDLAHRKHLLEQGRTVSLDVTDAENSLALAKDARSAAYFSWNEARIDLMQVMGTIGTLAQ